MRAVTLVLLRLGLALRARRALASRSPVLRAAHVRVHCVRGVAAVRENDIPIGRLVFVAYILLDRLLRHASDQVSTWAVHEVDHLWRHVASHRLLLWRTWATLRSGIQLLLAVLVASCTPLRVSLMDLRPRVQLLLRLPVRHHVVARLL